MEENKKDKQVMNLGKVFKDLWKRKKVFFITWIVTIILSALWIFPQPRFYSCSVSMAPETASESAQGGLASIASSFGVNIGGGGNDAIYPTLYPNLFQSPEFVVGLFNIKVKTMDNRINCDYYTYLAKYQKMSWWGLQLKRIKDLFPKKHKDGPKLVKDINAFRLSEYDTSIEEEVEDKVHCSVNKKDNIISIVVEDQDPLICATLADSVRERLQDFIIEYRTHKSRIDVMHYQKLTDAAYQEYQQAINKYAKYCDSNEDPLLKSVSSRQEDLENEMQMKYNTYQAMSTQLQATKAKLQERTPAFTTLKSATVPTKPAGPKRILFILAMLILVTIAETVWFSRSELKKLFI